MQCARKHCFINALTFGFTVVLPKPESGVWDKWASQSYIARVRGLTSECHLVSKHIIILAALLLQCSNKAQCQIISYIIVGSRLNVLQWEEAISKVVAIFPRFMTLGLPFFSRLCSHPASYFLDLWRWVWTQQGEKWQLLYNVLNPLFQNTALTSFWHCTPCFLYGYTELQYERTNIYR